MNDREIALSIYILGCVSGYFMLKKSYMQWCSLGENKFDWSGRIPCLFFAIGSWIVFLVALLIFAMAGGFDKK